MTGKSPTPPLIALITASPANTAIVGTMIGKKLTFCFMRRRGFEAYYAKLAFPNGARGVTFHFENMN